jgi:DNA polymerase-3 subunit delta'
LISENEEDLIQTIRSRCQILHFNGLSEPIITEALVSREKTNPNIAAKIAHQAQEITILLSLLHASDEEHPFEQWFVTWVRAAFQAKKDASAIHDLILWVKKLQD